MKKYEYLIYSLIFLAAFALALYKRRDLKPHVVIPCLAGAIAGPLSELMYFRDYWRPYTLFGQAVPGIEDVIFGSSAVGLTLLIYPLFFRRREWQMRHKKHGVFSVAYIALGTSILLGLLYLQVNSVIATAITCSILLAPLVMLRKDLLQPALWSGLLVAGFAGLIYLVGVGMFFKTTLPDIWLLNDTPLGITLFRYVPLTELLWFFTVGSFLEAFELYVHELHYRRMARTRRRSTKSIKPTMRRKTA